ncbi:MAG: hypothetical protein KA792_05035 [Bacteroidales bacterium]|nr:hypothetical protein [Bacteroidales bacterium]
MKYIADLHIHSHYSIATSKELTPEHLDYWAKAKGINVIGTGDFTHPRWSKELKEKLIPAENGLFKLKDDLILRGSLINSDIVFSKTLFILSAEISCIYKKKGKTRKIHNVVLADSFETVEKIQNKLTDYKFNISSDGRPILGLDARDLFELLLNCSENIFLIPAHIWTPWFSVLGAKSGFDSIEECYEDLSERIYTLETGLSSDPPMNWLCSSLDKYTLVSNSDAHSPEKLGRNANIFNTDFNYLSLINALKTGDTSQCLGTIDMYPQEGKYHFAGHSNCGICLSPEDSVKFNGICPVCNKEVTIGVMNRVNELADRNKPEERQNKLPFYHIIPLKEILSEILGKPATSKHITNYYEKLLNKFGQELHLLLDLSFDEIKDGGEPQLAEAIKRMRAGEIYIKEGYDGEYGIIKVFGERDFEDTIKNIKKKPLNISQNSNNTQSKQYNPKNTRQQLNKPEIKKKQRKQIYKDDNQLNLF